MPRPTRLLPLASCRGHRSSIRGAPAWSVYSKLPPSLLPIAIIVFFFRRVTIITVDVLFSRFTLEFSYAFEPTDFVSPRKFPALLELPQTRGWISLRSYSHLDGVPSEKLR